MPIDKASDCGDHAPEDFAPVLASGAQLFLVGGQAVNLWALYYRDRTSAMAPFVSRDLDVLGNRETLSEIAAFAGVRPQFFPMRPPSNEIGVAIAKGTDGRPLPVEVLNHVHGISNEELRQPAYTFVLGEDKATVRVPGPIALLKAKISNVADLAQAGRQDVRHVRILALLLPAYLADIHASAADGRVSERDMLNLIKFLLAVLTSSKARKVLKKLGISGRGIFSELNPVSSNKLHTFLTNRLSRALPE